MAGGLLQDGIIKRAGSLTPGWTCNLGLKKVGNITSICQANGDDLTPNTPAWVTVPSDGNPGRLVTLMVTLNTHVIEDAGSGVASDIVGEQFGVVSGQAWAENRPFAIYAINNGDKHDYEADGLRFAISPSPCLARSPLTTNIGWHGNPMATPADYGFFFMFDTDPSITHDEKPCIKIGNLRGTMSAIDDWTLTVPTIQYKDGITQEWYSNLFKMPYSQMGANTGVVSLFNCGGGAPPTWATPTDVYGYYRLLPNGVCIHTVSTTNAGNVAAGHASQLQTSLPYRTNNNLIYINTMRKLVGDVVLNTTHHDLQAEIYNNLTISGFYFEGSIVNGGGFGNALDDITFQIVYHTNLIAI